MTVKYYYFNSIIGDLRLYFIVDTVVGFAFEKDTYISKYIEKNYGIAEEVDANEYKFHEEIIEYLNGQRQEFNLNIEFKGTEFQKKVWNELLKIPYGQVYTYKSLAEKIDNPRAVRAVGGALNKNPIAIIIPCHRIIGTNNKLTGFAGGLDTKEKLITLEKNNII